MTCSGVAVSQHTTHFLMTRHYAELPSSLANVGRCARSIITPAWTTN